MFWNLWKFIFTKFHPYDMFTIRSKVSFGIVVEWTFSRSAMLWGLSPALDIIAEVKKIKEIASDSELNVLLIGSSDARHILKTMAQLKRHSKELKVSIYIIEVLIR